MRTKRNEWCCSHLANLGMACVGVLGIVFMAGAKDGFAITKPESIPQDTGEFGTTQTTSTRPIQDKQLLTN